LVGGEEFDCRERVAESRARAAGGGDCAVFVGAAQAVRVGRAEVDAGGRSG
jgi:hypothetical protein